MRIIFMGTPDFAVPCLRMLILRGYDMAAMVTQPDRAKGRGKRLSSPPVKKIAEEAGIPVYQPEKVKTDEFTQILRDLNPDVIITVAFGQILSQDILDIPPLGCINVHASLLPKYRGAAPINWSIINGEKITGITTMYMDKGLDTGDIIMKKEIEIGENETAEELHDRLSELGASVLSETVTLLERGTIQRIPQNNEEATYAPIMTKSLGRIDWSKDAGEIRNLIRGTCPWPGAYSSYNGKKFKIFRAAALENNGSNTVCGTIIGVSNEGIVISCGTGSLRIEELQFENGSRMSAEAYLRGHRICMGAILGKTAVKTH